MNKTSKIIISDETLRDGEQQVGVNFSYHDKLIIAKKVAEIGAEQIAIMPIISKYEEKISKKLLNSSFGNKMYASTMLDNEFVDHSLSLGFQNIILFCSLSDRLLKIKKMTREQNLKKAINVCKYAANKGLNVIFAGEDSTRADINYVIKFIQSIQKYIEGFLLCDTVGVLTPQKTKKLISFIKRNIKCRLGVHFHNDRSLGNANTITAIKNGAEIISGTVGGIGERAGNADWCNILMQLKKEHIIFDNIKYSELPKIKSLVYRLGGIKPARPYSARAFWVESGIHVDALMVDKLSYNSFLPERYGKKIRIFYGKFSGKANYKYLFGEKYSDEQLIKIRDKIKEFSYKNKKSYNSREVKILVKNIKI
jgi:homocitrate synthase NifV/benzylmalate synthase